MEAFMNKLQKLIILVLATSIYSGWLLASPSENPSLNSYLIDTLIYHLTQEKYNANIEFEQLRLRHGKQKWPDISVRTAFDEVTNEVDAASLSSSIRTIDSGVTTGLDAKWTSLIGTNINIGLEHQYGRQVGRTLQGIPGDVMQAQNLSLEISQPLLKHNSPGYNRSESHKADLQWNHFRQKSEFNQFELLRNALLGYVAMQEDYDRLQVSESKLLFTQSIIKTTEVLVVEGRNLPIDLELAVLDFRRQKQTIENARNRFSRSQQNLTLQWTHESASIPVQINMQALVNIMTPVLDGNLNLTTHPEYTQASIVSELASIEEYVSQRDHWPDLEVYYRISKKYRDALPDEQSQAWGVELRYSLSNNPTRQQQALRRAEATIANWDKIELLWELEWQADLHTKNSENLIAEGELNSYGIELAGKALDHELKRYGEGQSSYRNVQLRQQDLLDRQLATLLNKSELASELVYLAYYEQWDWLEYLAN